VIFKPMTGVYPGQPPMWAARRGDHSFLITDESEGFFATARRAYTTEPHPIPGELIELGVFPSMQKAIEACVKWKP
jgi:hypothetical protein